MPEKVRAERSEPVHDQRAVVGLFGKISCEKEPIVIKCVFFCPVCSNEITWHYLLLLLLINSSN